MKKPANQITFVKSDPSQNGGRPIAAVNGKTAHVISHSLSETGDVVTLTVVIRRREDKRA